MIRAEKLLQVQLLSFFSNTGKHWHRKGVGRRERAGGGGVDKIFLTYP